MQAAPPVRVPYAPRSFLAPAPVRLRDLLGDEAAALEKGGVALKDAQMTDRRQQPDRRANDRAVPEERRTGERRGPFMTVKEYADYRRVHVETVKRWIKDGLIEADRVGERGHWRVRIDPAA